MTTDNTEHRGRRSPHLAAILSFLWPGLGQWYAGRRREAMLFGLPVAIVAVLALSRALAGVEQLVAFLVAPSSALTVVILIVLVGAWRLVALADALTGFGRRDPWRRGRTAVTFSVLALGIVLAHGGSAVLAWSFYDAASRIFVGDTNPDATPRPTPRPGATPHSSDDYHVEPVQTPPTREARINILLTGLDSAETRTHALTDTLIVASIDPTTKQVALISFPRDIANFELWDGRTYRGKINSFMTYARNRPAEFPDGPFASLVRQIGHMLGVPIHYYAAVDLHGFRRMIDVVGGITVDNPRAINDPSYDWFDGTRGFVLPAGRQTLDGRRALAYVRSRMGAGDNDFTRARRQQQVLVALRNRLTTPEILPKLGEILDAAGDTIRTNFPSDRVGEMLKVAGQVDDDGIVRVVLGPPYAVHPPTSTTDGVYTLRLQMDKVAELSIELFGSDSAYQKP